MSFIVDFFTGGDVGAQGASRANELSREGIEEIRKQLGITQGDVRPFIELGQRQIPGVERGTTAEGLDEILGEILGTESFQNLRDERTRTLQGHLSASGLTRSGTALEEIAEIPTDLAFQIEQLLSGRQQQILGGGQQAALGLGGLSLQGAANIGGIASGSANRLFEGIQGDAERRAAFFDSIIGGGSRIGSASILASDPCLKMNVRPVGVIGKLVLYIWDWIPAISGTRVAKQPTLGFMANEVREYYPAHVHDFNGFDGVNYTSLLNQLEQEAS